MTLICSLIFEFYGWKIIYLHYLLSIDWPTKIFCEMFHDHILIVSFVIGWRIHWMTPYNHFINVIARNKISKGIIIMFNIFIHLLGNVYQWFNRSLTWIITLTICLHEIRLTFQWIIITGSKNYFIDLIVFVWTMDM